MGGTIHRLQNPSTRLNCKSRMKREFHVRFCERLGVKLPLPTRLLGSRFRLDLDFLIERNRSNTEVFRGFWCVGHAVNVSGGSPEYAW